MRSDLKQHGLDAFRRYEKDIARIVENYPKETLLDPKPFSEETYMARIRDAIKGMRLNQHASQHFTLGQCENIFSHLRSGGTFIFTRYTGGLVRCGEKERVEARGAVDVKNVALDVNPGEVDARNEEIFNAIVLLKERDIISSPVTLKNLSDIQLSRIHQSFNLELMEGDEPHQHVLL